MLKYPQKPTYKLDISLHGIVAICSTVWNRQLCIKWKSAWTAAFFHPKSLRGATCRRNCCRDDTVSCSHCKCRREIMTKPVTRPSWNFTISTLMNRWPNSAVCPMAAYNSSRARRVKWYDEIPRDCYCLLPSDEHAIQLGHWRASVIVINCYWIACSVLTAASPAISASQGASYQSPQPYWVYRFNVPLDTTHTVFSCFISIWNIMN